MKANFQKLLSKSKIIMATLPNFFYVKKLHAREDILELQTLKKTGFVRYKNIISDEECVKISNLIDELINKKKISFIEKQKIWKLSSVDDFINITEEILNFKNISDLISDYFKKEFFLSDFDIRRVEPADHNEISKMGQSNSDWHKDIRGKQLKLMIYITDVNEYDNHFSIIPQSQFKRVYDFNSSRFLDENINTKNQIKILGKKGTGILFDTNVIHRLNRLKSSKVRDTITLNFTPGQYLKKIYFSDQNKLEGRKIHKKIINNSLFFKRD
tara:strand:+ start:46167 stop:46979 length:813 start_codon:yes stop_codon:yes gene_type:complete